jgi:hypothetical protein
MGTYFGLDADLRCEKDLNYCREIVESKGFSSLRIYSSKFCIIPVKKV